MITMSALAGLLTVFFLRMISMTFGTARQIIVVRGFKYPGAVLGFFEILIYTVAITTVIRNGAWTDMVAYALGFATGTIVGAAIEEKLALGYYSVRIITHDKAKEISEELRSHGFGVTVVVGEGRDGIVYVLEVILRRRDMPALQKYVRGIHDKAFITSGEAHSVQRGFFISESTR
jgi:uncharacterized protein YebE (UPF0316 family)